MSRPNQRDCVCRILTGMFHHISTHGASRVCAYISPLNWCPYPYRAMNGNCFRGPTITRPLHACTYSVQRYWRIHIIQHTVSLLALPEHCERAESLSRKKKKAMRQLRTQAINGRYDVPLNPQLIMKGQYCGVNPGLRLNVKWHPWLAFCGPAALQACNPGINNPKPQYVRPPSNNNK